MTSDLNLEDPCAWRHTFGDCGGVRAVEEDWVLVLDILNLDDDVLEGTEGPLLAPVPGLQHQVVGALVLEVKRFLEHH